MGVGDNDSLKVYVRLPVKIKEELQIKDLHPDIQTVKLPRQKSRRWCFIEFQDKDTLVRVVKHLRSLKINDKNIVVKNCKKREPRKVKSPVSTSGNEAVQARLELLKKDQQ